MLTIICGEDNISSRNYYLSLKNNYLNKGFSLQEINFDQILDILNWSSQSLTLFGEKKIFFMENINKYLSKAPLRTIDDLKKISKTKEIELVIWEDLKSTRDLKLKTIGVIKEFKPTKTIFKLLGACYPDNFKNFILLLESMVETVDQNFILVMLSRHTRNLLLAKLNLLSSSLQPWQKSKLIAQSRFWSLEKLLKFYQGLFRIELSLKTGTTPYGIKRSLDILACYFL